MRIAAIFVFCSCAIAQEVLPPGKPVKLEISSGATREYAVQLRPDDYVDVSITRHGKTDVAVFRPNGVLLRRFPAPPMDGKCQMAFVVENLIAASKIPPTVAVFVNTSGERRLNDLIPNPQFADFMAKELVPWVRSRYHVTSDPAKIVVGGFSAGGLAAAYMGLRHPQVFGKVLSQSGAFWWAPDHYQNADSTTETNWMAQQYIAGSKLPVNFYLHLERSE